MLDHTPRVLDALRVDAGARPNLDLEHPGHIGETRSTRQATPRRRGGASSGYIALSRPLPLLPRRCKPNLLHPVVSIAVPAPALYTESPHRAKRSAVKSTPVRVLENPANRLSSTKLCIAPGACRVHDYRAAANRRVFPDLTRSEAALSAGPTLRNRVSGRWARRQGDRGLRPGCRG